jgi:SAM-dependent methyltransferase
VTVFDRIYRENLWNGVESRSGPGSGPVATRRVALALRSLVDNGEIASVLDVGCGDGYWMPDLPGYVGYDASREAIRMSRRRHPDRRYTNVWPTGTFDLVICRDVMQHLPLADGVELLARIRATGSRLLLASTYVGGDNIDIAPGEAYSPDLTAEPFGLPEPDAAIFDGYHYHETPELRDERKHLGLWRLSTS